MRPTACRVPRAVLYCKNKYPRPFPRVEYPGVLRLICAWTPRSSRVRTSVGGCYRHKCSPIHGMVSGA
eukprot:727584-Prymnesium_polylepis.1